MFEPAVCLNIAQRVREQCSESWIDLYYKIGQTQRNKNHSACTEATCFANDLQNSKILPGHTSPKCSCPLVGADANQLRETLESHGAALLRLEERDKNIEIKVEPMANDMKYFAISHALADGLCNTEGNELPQCQLRRILRCVASAMPIQNLPWDYPIYIWIDIMCLPLRSSLSHGVTTKTFNTLGRVMGDAVAVLVLDTDIALLSRTSSYAERFLRISFSSWGSRLWTLFEAIMAPKLLFECTDGVMELNDFLESSSGLSTIEDAANWRPLLFSRLGKSRKRYRDDQDLLRHALQWNRTSVETDSAGLKKVIKNLFEFSTIDRHIFDNRHRL